VRAIAVSAEHQHLPSRAISCTRPTLPTIVPTISLSSGADALGRPRANYFVGLIGAAGRELATVVLQCADDVQVVAWARRVAGRREFAAVRVERKGSILRRLPTR
jgi:hypothetical protein